jgi:hypothetical protein
MVGQTDAESLRDDESPEPFIPPKIDKLIPIVAPNGKLHKLEEKAATIRGDMGAAYKGLQDDFHGNRKAVKLIRGLIGMSQDKAMDFMRTFLPLASHFHLMPEEDLVSAAERATAHGQRVAAAKEEPEQKLGDTAPVSREAGADPLPERTNAIDRAREHLQGGTKPAPASSETDDLGQAGEEEALAIKLRREADEFANRDKGPMEEAPLPKVTALPPVAKTRAKPAKRQAAADRPGGTLRIVH